jgi:hypothetical protein
MTPRDGRSHPTATLSALDARVLRELPITNAPKSWPAGGAKWLRGSAWPSTWRAARCSGWAAATWPRTTAEGRGDGRGRPGPSTPWSGSHERRPDGPSGARSRGEGAGRASGGCWTCEAIYSALGPRQDARPSRPVLARGGRHPPQLPHAALPIEAGPRAPCARRTSRRSTASPTPPLATLSTETGGRPVRLAMAAWRLCQEIAGRRPPTATEVPKR